MTPTQAQIEAAAKAIQSEIGTTLITPLPYEKAATAALTAAAEVDRGVQTGKALTGNLNEVSLGENSESVLHHHTAAAEQSFGSYSVAEVDRIVEQTKFATIKRCAEVAENSIAFAIAGKSIAAAIRKLKDEA